MRTKLKELTFIPHPAVQGGVLARVFFPNGYGASIVGGGRGLYGDGVQTFEVAVLKGNNENWELCYSTPITNDVLGHRSINEVNEILTQIKAL